MELLVLLTMLVLTCTSFSNFEVPPFEESARLDVFELTAPEEHPYAILLLLLTDDGKKIYGICSGSLLNGEWVLTAAHCLLNQNSTIGSINWLVYAGVALIPELWSRSGSVYEPQMRHGKDILPHPLYYKAKSPKFDIGLVRVEKEFTFSDIVRPIEIGKFWNGTKKYSSCLITGFGVVQMNKDYDEDNMRKTQRLLIKKPCDCYDQLKQSLGEDASKTYLCSKAQEDYGLCFGDSGGGLVCDGVLQGIAVVVIPADDIYSCNFKSKNFSMMKTRPEDYQCGVHNLLNVFLFAPRYLPWIQCHVNLTYSDISADCDVSKYDKNQCPRQPKIISPLIISVMVFQYWVYKCIGELK